MSPRKPYSKLKKTPFVVKDKSGQHHMAVRYKCGHVGWVDCDGGDDPDKEVATRAYFAEISCEACSDTMSLNQVKAETARAHQACDRVESGDLD